MSEHDLARARAQAAAQFESIRELVDALAFFNDGADWEAKAEELGFVMTEDQDGDLPWTKDATSFVDAEAACRSIFGRDFPDYEDAALERIYENALSVRVRSGWYSPGEDSAAEEYEILLCTGGPAVRIVGDLDRGEASSARLEFQDWFTPWTEWRGEDVPDDAGEVLLAYARVHYFGEA